MVLLFAVNTGFQVMVREPGTVVSQPLTHPASADGAPAACLWHQGQNQAEGQPGSELVPVPGEVSPGSLHAAHHTALSRGSAWPCPHAELGGLALCRLCLLRPKSFGAPLLTNVWVQNEDQL